MAGPFDTRALHTQGAAAWPGIAVDPTRFDGAVRARLAANGDDSADGEPFRAGELYLAIACETGDPAAIAAFERDFMGPLRTVLAAAERDADVLDEVIQRARVRALVGEDGAPPRIATYSGRASLAGWLRVLALRVLANLRRDRRRGPIPAGESVEHVAAPATLAPEKLLLDQRFGPPLRRALGEALRALPPRERALLRFHYVEGLALERIGTVYGVHKGTISRWLAAARDRVLEAAIATLRTETGLADDAELESLCGFLRSRLELSLSAFYSQGGAPVDVDLPG